MLEHRDGRAPACHLCEKQAEYARIIRKFSIDDNQITFTAIIMKLASVIGVEAHRSVFRG